MTETATARLLGWARRLVERLGRDLATAARGRQRRLILDTLLLGVVGAASAQLFTLMLRGAISIFLVRLAGYRPPALPGEGGPEVIGPHGLWLVPVATTLGGLLVGLLTEWLAPEVEGHGTDTVIRAFHRADGFVRARVAPLKLIASAITIGSGGAAGREGPIALVAAGFGSWYATLTGRTGRDRRLLLLVGAAAGLSAIFRSPIGAALLVIEVLYADMEFEASALLYATLAAIVAYALNGFVAGWGPLFRIPPIAPLQTPLEYGWYAVLGIAAGALGTLLPIVFYRVRDLFRAMPVQPFLKPAIGGLVMGAIALVFPQVIGGGYGWMQRAIDGKLALELLAALAVVKIVALSFTVASGGSGGVFAPSLFSGAMLGGALAAMTHLPPAPFVIVGMAAVFAGAAHVPIATMMMVIEMTGSYTLLVPAALAVMVSYLVQTRLSGHARYRSIYEAQVTSRADSPAHHKQHLDIALRLLRESGRASAEQIGELDLVALLQAGIPVELGDDRRLALGILRADSPLAHTTVAASGDKLDGDGSTILAIIRGGRTLTPHADTMLEAGDKLVLVVTDAGGPHTARHFEAC